MKDLRAFLLCTTALRRGNVYRLAVENRPLTAHERVQRAIAEAQHKLAKGRAMDALVMGALS